MRLYSIILALFAFAFFLRVLGQFLVSTFEIDWLPPMTEWYSGLLPYPVLLPMQFVILGAQLEISRELWVGRGPLVRRRPRLGSILHGIAIASFLVMVVRYVVTMTLVPERRWFGGTIPIFFHWVLAAYLFLFSRFLRTRDDSPSSSR